MLTNFDEINNPHLELCLSRLSANYELYNRLNERIRLIKEGYANKSEFEKNEIELTIIKTKAEAEAQKKILVGREEYFKKFVKEFSKELEDCEKNFESVVLNAREKAKKNTTLAKLIDTANFEGVKTNSEAKVKLYQQLKNFL